VLAGFGADPEYESDPGTTLLGLLWFVDLTCFFIVFSVVVFVVVDPE
jgi:hypothetical protein